MNPNNNIIFKIIIFSMEYKYPKGKKEINKNDDIWVIS